MAASDNSVRPRADSASVHDDPYPAAPEPTPADRQPVVLEPYDSDLADLLALVRGVRSGNTVAVAFLLTSGNAGLMLITAVKLLAELTRDAAETGRSSAHARSQLPAQGRQPRQRHHRRHVPAGRAHATSVVGVRLTDAELTRLDAMRGEQARSARARDLIAAALAGSTTTPAASPHRRAARPSWTRSERR